jgi:hypothetical protein
MIEVTETQFTLIFTFGWILFVLPFLPLLIHILCAPTINSRRFGLLTTYIFIVAFTTAWVKFAVTILNPLVKVIK